MFAHRVPLVVYAGMDRNSTKPNLPVLAFFSLMAISLGGLLLLPPIPQDQSYHEFADQRTILGVPNFWNVVSNLPFLAVGAAGLRRFRDNPATVVFFLGVLPGARDRKDRSYFALASARSWFVQPVVLALDRRSPALLLGAIFPRPRSVIAVFAVSA